MRNNGLLTTLLVIALLGVLAPALNLNRVTEATETLGAGIFAAASSLPPFAEWNQTYGGANNDYAHSVVQTNDGGYLVAGSTESFGHPDGDVWLVKTDALGNELWDREFGGDAYDDAFALRNTTDGGCIVAGMTLSFGQGNGDFWLLKLDHSGNEMWNKTYGGSGVDGAGAVCQTADGGYVVGGFTSSAGAGGFDALLFGLDSSGGIIWSKVYGGTGDDKVDAVCQTIDGGFAWAGTTESFGAGNGDFWLIKTDGSGAATWNRTFGGPGSEYACSVQQTGDEGYVVAGSTDSFGAGLSDFWLVRTDGAGNQVWNNVFGGTEDDYANSAIQTSEGDYLLAGSTESYGAGSEDFWLVEVNSTGNMLWSKTYGKTTSDVANSVQQTNDKGFIIAGTTVVSNDDAWLIKLGSTGPDLTPPTTADNYDGQWHRSDFTINLTATDDRSGIAETYYRINDEPARTVSANNQPFITTESADNILEYWSVDSSGNEELPHKVTYGIKLDKTPPISDAGADQTVDEDAAVMLNGSASHDENGISSYIWSFTDVTLQLLDGKNPTYTFETPGMYTITLKAFDAAGNYGVGNCTITVLDITKPVAIAGQDRTVRPNETVTFDASDSTDNVGIASYEWDFGDGTTATGRIATHVYASENTYTVTLTVKDSAGNTATNSITITVSSKGPIEALYPWIIAGVAVIIVVIAATIILLRRRGPPRK